LRTNTFKTSPLVTAAAVAAAFAATAISAFAQAPATPPAPAPASPPPNYNIQYNGLFDGYYLYQFENPKQQVLVDPIRFYDNRHNTPTLALGELNVLKNPKPGGFGFKTTLGAGDIATANGGGAGTLESRFQSIMQGYGTYALPGGGGVDFGKFYTPIGYEVTESNGNFNETHSVPFSVIPFYHFGVRAYTPSFQGWVLTAYAVQAIYNTANAGVENDTKSASFVGNITWTDPKNKWTVGESVGIGKNKFNLIAGLDATKNKVTVSDTDITYNLTASQTLGADYTYAQTNPDTTADSFKATVDAWAGYYKQVLTPKTDIAVRYSGGTLKSDAPGSMSVKPWEATATYELHPAANFTTRIEYQHSGANVPIFEDKSSAITKKSQDTLELAGLFTFSS